MLTFNMFNKIKKKQSDEAQQLSNVRNKTCVPVAKEILKMIADYKEVTQGMGDIVPHKLKQSYTELSTNILTLLLKENIKVAEVSYVFRLVLQPYNFVKEIVEESVNQHMSIAMEKIWGKPEMDVKMQELDDLLTGKKVLTE